MLESIHGARYVLRYLDKSFPCVVTVRCNYTAFLELVSAMPLILIRIILGKVQSGMISIQLPPKRS